MAAPFKTKAATNVVRNCPAAINKKNAVSLTSASLLNLLKTETQKNLRPIFFFNST